MWDYVNQKQEANYKSAGKTNLSVNGSVNEQSQGITWSFQKGGHGQNDKNAATDWVYTTIKGNRWCK